MVEKSTIAPGIVIFDNVIENPNKYIELACSQSEWMDSLIVDDDNRENVKNEKHRRSRTLNLPIGFSYPIEWFELSKIIWTYADQYGTEFKAPFSSMETLQMLHYPVGDYYYKPHSDAGENDPRIFSSLLYLNDVEEGGETYFSLFDISIKPKAGRLALFPAQYSYIHEAKPPISEEKFVVVTWFRQVIAL